MKQMSVIGSGRWGAFLGWYAANWCGFDKVFLYDLPDSPNFIELRDMRRNSFLELSGNMEVTPDIVEALSSDFIIVSTGCQHLRGLAKQLNGFDIAGKTFLLANKGLEEGTAKTLEQIFSEEISQPIHIAVLSGPGHVQDYMKKVPSCAVIDSFERETQERVIGLMTSDLIRFYYGSDMVGNQIGAALKNVIGIAAGILDGLGWQGLKGALMTRAPVEVGRFIEHLGGKARSVYGLAHLGDYEATLFSPHSQNRQFGELFVKGESYGRLAEGCFTLKAVKAIADRDGIDMPICQALYRAVYERTDIKATIREMFERGLKDEF